MRITTQLKQRIKKIPKVLLIEYRKDNDLLDNDDYLNHLMYASEDELQDILDCTIGG